MAKLADALRLGRSMGNRILVQVQLAAHGSAHQPYSVPFSRTVHGTTTDKTMQTRH